MGASFTDRKLQRNQVSFSHLSLSFAAALVILEEAGMGSDAAEVVRRYFAAWPARDRAGAEAVVAADFHFTSPLDNRLDRETYLRALLAQQRDDPLASISSA